VILSDRQILEAIKRRDIVIEPFDDNALGTNSYDVHLGSTLMVAKGETLKLPLSDFADESGAYILWDNVLDCRKPYKVEECEIGPEGYVLIPNRFYLGVTVEYTETHKHVPFLDGKSSIGRYGITIHCTAGRGDVGFCNHWTLEMHVQQPVRVYANMPIGQLIYFETGEVNTPYNKKPSAKYNERCNKPQPSQMFKNFLR